MTRHTKIDIACMAMSTAFCIAVLLLAMNQAGPATGLLIKAGVFVATGVAIAQFVWAVHESAAFFKAPNLTGTALSALVVSTLVFNAVGLTGFATGCLVAAMFAAPPSLGESFMRLTGKYPFAIDDSYARRGDR